MQFLPRPHRHRLAERHEAVRGVGEVRLEQPFEFFHRLFVEHYVIQVFGRDASLSQTILDRIEWKLRVVFPACEPLFLCGRGDLAVAYQRSSRVVIKRGNSENPRHRLSASAGSSRSLRYSSALSLIFGDTIHTDALKGESGYSNQLNRKAKTFPPCRDANRIRENGPDLVLSQELSRAKRKSYPTNVTRM